MVCSLYSMMGGWSNGLREVDQMFLSYLSVGCLASNCCSSSFAGLSTRKLLVFGSWCALLLLRSSFFWPPSHNRFGLLHADMSLNCLPHHLSWYGGASGSHWCIHGASGCLCWQLHSKWWQHSPWSTRLRLTEADLEICSCKSWIGLGCLRVSLCHCSFSALSVSTDFKLFFFFTKTSSAETPKVHSYKLSW